MKYTTCLLSALVGVSSVVALPASSVLSKRVNEALIPPLGIARGVNPTGTGDCDGAIGPNGQPIKIPCACPPDQGELVAQLNANVAAGHAVKNPGAPVSFPEDGSPGSQIARIQAVIVTLQNLNGPGVGCPAAATTLLAQQAAVHKRHDEDDFRPEQVKRESPKARSAVDVRRLQDSIRKRSVASQAPPLGFTSGRNPTGTGDCDGAVKGANGKPIKIPCSCPPSQAEYINQLQANVKAGHAVHNPAVQVRFPLDNSANSKRQRIQAALVTIQNLKGPGVGCPAVSTTLSAQLNAVKG